MPNQLDQAVRAEVRPMLAMDRPTGLYRAVMMRVEKPLFECVLRHTNGNQSNASKILGICHVHFKELAPGGNLNGVAVSDRLTKAVEAEASVLLKRYAPANVHKTIKSRAEKALLDRVLNHSSGNQTKAAGLLGLDRVTVRAKLVKYGLYLPEGGNV